MKPSIFIADDHPILIKGLNDLLLEKGYNIIGSSTNGQASNYYSGNKVKSRMIFHVYIFYLNIF